MLVPDPGIGHMLVVHRDSKEHHRDVSLFTHGQHPPGGIDGIRSREDLTAVHRRAFLPVLVQCLCRQALGKSYEPAPIILCRVKFGGLGMLEVIFEQRQVVKKDVVVPQGGGPGIGDIVQAEKPEHGLQFQLQVAAGLETLEMVTQQAWRKIFLNILMDGIGFKDHHPGRNNGKGFFQHITAVVLKYARGGQDEAIEPRHVFQHLRAEPGICVGIADNEHVHGLLLPGILIQVVPLLADMVVISLSRKHPSDIAEDNDGDQGHCNQQHLQDKFPETLFSHIRTGNK